MSKPMLFISLACVAAGAALAWQVSAAGLAQAPAGAATREASADAKFEFEVIESIDAEYLGDTPGHHGRSGGLGTRRPQVALGDPVFRGEEQVGTLTQIVWDRTRGSLDLEFDPSPLKRVCVGDVVWVAIDGSRPPQGAVPDNSPPTR